MRAIFDPLNGEIKIDFCSDKKKFYFSAPLSSAAYRSIRTYVEARKERSFRPYATSFHLTNEEVHLVQEIPFNWGHQPSMRQQIHQFRRYLQRCRKIFSDLAIEELSESARSPS